MLGTVDAALAGVVATEKERDRRLQEVVHELRTPLTSVFGFSAILAQEWPTLSGEEIEELAVVDAGTAVSGQGSGISGGEMLKGSKAATSWGEDALGSSVKRWRRYR